MTTMVQQAGAQAAKDTSGSSLSMLRTLGGIALVSGFLLSLVYQATEARIANNFEVRVRDAVFGLLPGATRQQMFNYTGIDAAGAEKPFTAYAGYDDAGNLVGLALEAADNNGYGGDIKLLYGYLPDKQQIIGMTVLLCRETPGLGDRIITDETFTANFKQLDVALNAEGNALSNPIICVKPGKGGGPGQVEGISGATISSKAVVRALQNSAALAMPVIKQRLGELKEAPL